MSGFESPACDVVLAGAGTGKTFVLTNRIIHLVLEGVKADEILALTFTVAAAKEMKTRVQEGLFKSGFRGRFPTIHTFHGLAYNIIRDTIEEQPNWARIGFQTSPKLITDGMFRRFLSSVKKMDGLSFSESAIRSWLDSPFTKATSAKKTQETRTQTQILKLYVAFLQKNGLLSFGDMVFLAGKLVKNHKSVRHHYHQKYAHIVVDECQDTSPDQFSLIHTLSSPKTHHFFVGDDDQAIYGFRGADAESIHQILDTYKNARVHKLEVNYRSTLRVLQYANTIFRHKPDDLKKVLTAGRKSTHPLFLANQTVKVRLFNTGFSEASWIAGRIKYLINSGLSQYDDIAILVRLNRQKDYYRGLFGKLIGEASASHLRFQTIHGAKGLQFPVVFLVGMEHGVFPYFRNGEELSQSRYEEECRLFYVAVTRAEYQLYITAAKKRVIQSKPRRMTPSPFIVNNGRWTSRVMVHLLSRLGG